MNGFAVKFVLVAFAFGAALKFVSDALTKHSMKFILHLKINDLILITLIDYRL